MLMRRFGRLVGRHPRFTGSVTTLGLGILAFFAWAVPYGARMEAETEAMVAFTEAEAAELEAVELAECRTSAVCRAFAKERGDVIARACKVSSIVAHDFAVTIWHRLEYAKRQGVTTVEWGAWDGAPNPYMIGIHLCYPAEIKSRLADMYCYPCREKGCEKAIFEGRLVEDPDCARDPKYGRTRPDFIAQDFDRAVECGYAPRIVMDHVDRIEDRCPGFTHEDACRVVGMVHRPVYYGGTDELQQKWNTLPRFLPAPFYEYSQTEHDRCMDAITGKHRGLSLQMHSLIAAAFPDTIGAGWPIAVMQAVEESRRDWSAVLRRLRSEYDTSTEDWIETDAPDSRESYTFAGQIE